MTKFYRINLVENKEIFTVLNKEIKGNLNACKPEFIEFVKYLKNHFKLQNEKDKIKIIDGNFYELLEHFQKNLKEIAEIAKTNEEYKILYSDYIFTLFNNQIMFFVQEIKDEWINENFKNRFWVGNYFVITDEPDQFTSLKDRCFIGEDSIFKRKNGDYNLAFNERNFILFDANLSKFQDEIYLSKEQNIFKNLIIQLIALSYENINLSVKEKLQNEFDLISVDEVLELKKKFFSYKIMTNYEIKEDRKEASDIFTLVKKTLKFEEKYDEISKNLSDFFEIIKEETNIKEEKYRQKELERKEKEQIQRQKEYEDARVQREFERDERQKALEDEKRQREIERDSRQEELRKIAEEREKEKAQKEAEKEKRDKFNSKITLIAATITILTFISVVADIFNLFDRFFK